MSSLRRRDLDRLRDRDPETARGVLGLRTAGLGELGGAAMDRAAPGLDHRPPVRLLVIGDPDHEHLAFEAEELARERQRGAPLPGAGLGGELAHALLLVVEGLGHRGVRLVRAGGRDPLVLVVDVGRGIERALQALRAVERGRTPQPVHVADLVGDRDLRLGRDLLLDQPHGEDRRQVVGAERLLGRRVKRWRGGGPRSGSRLTQLGSGSPTRAARTSSARLIGAILSPGEAMRQRRGPARSR